MTYEEKVKFILTCAKRYAPSFEKSKFSIDDLVSDTVLYFIQDRDKFMNTYHSKSFVFNRMKWIKYDQRRSKQAQITTTGFIPERISNDYNYIESKLDLDTIVSWVRGKGTNNRLRKNNAIVMFDKLLLGYTQDEIAADLNVHKSTVSRSIHITKQEIKQKYSN